MGWNQILHRAAASVLSLRQTGWRVRTLLLLRKIRGMNTNWLFNSAESKLVEETIEELLDVSVFTSPKEGRLCGVHIHGDRFCPVGLPLPETGRCGGRRACEFQNQKDMHLLYLCDQHRHTYHETPLPDFLTHFDRLYDTDSDQAYIEQLRGQGCCKGLTSSANPTACLVACSAEVCPCSYRTTSHPTSGE